MKRAVVTVGLGFGDEGKGATVDFLARELGAELVVRYCGGSQAGHNVELPDGRRHTFSQFGAGTLAPHRPKTFLGPATVIDPPAMLRESRHLEELGVSDPLALVTVHPRALVTTSFTKLLNRVREVARGAAKHGSCGQGIGETRHYWLRYGNDAVFAADLFAESLPHKLELQRQRILLELQPLLETCPPDALHDLAADLWDATAADAADELCDPALKAVAVSPAAPPHTTAVFEGAQGVLLDEFRGFHPHTTWSTVTPLQAWELVREFGTREVAVLGITRAYATRHGDGPFPTHDADLTARLTDPGNPWNRWQGGIRCGRLDLPLLRYAAACCGRLDGLAVSHLDQVPGENPVCESYRGGELQPSPVPDLAWQSRLTERVRAAEPAYTPMTPDDVLRALGDIAPVVVTGRGPAHTHHTLAGLRFRRKRA